MKNIIPFLVLFFFQFQFLQAQVSDAKTDSKSANEVIAFFNVNVLPMDTNVVLNNQTVLIQNGKIIKIGPATEVRPDRNYKIIKATGKYLMPGISEMHAHIPVPTEEDSTIVEETLFLYLSNGITTIRGMLGQPFHLSLKKEVAAGKVLSPRIYTSSPSMNGNSIKTPEEAREKVAQYKKEGYDFLKIHPGLSLENFRALSETAFELEIDFAGHVPVDVGVQRALKSGYATIDHMDGYLEAMVPTEAGVDPNANGFFGFNFIDLINPDKMVSFVKQTKEHDVWVVPTQSLFAHLTSSEDVNIMANRSELKYVSPKTRFKWKTARTQLQQDSTFTKERAAKFMDFRNTLLKALQKNKIGILMGSDAPQIFNVPGFSIQHEMKAMRDAGLNPFQILQSGTVNPAKFFKEEGNFGVIREGASADILLLSGNPLKNIENMKKIEGVMVRGKFLRKALIEKKLKAIADKYSEQETPSED